MTTAPPAPAPRASDAPSAAAAAGAPAVELRGVTKRFRTPAGEVRALDGVDLRVPRGEVFGIVGRSGAGKSTLVRLVNRLEEPTEGAVLVDGRDLTTLRGAELRAARRRIGMVFQHFELLRSRTAAENVALPLEIAGAGRAERARRAAELLDLVGLGGRGDAYPSQLSGGQKQRVGIARALAAEPSVLLLDEATSALDAATTREVLDLVRDLNRRLGITVLLVTHEMDVVRRVCDSIAVLGEGRVVEAGPVAELVAGDGSPVAAALVPRHAVAGQVDVVALHDAAERAVATAVAGGAVRIAEASVSDVGGRRVGRYALDLADDSDGAAVVHALRAAGARAEVVA